MNKNPNAAVRLWLVVGLLAYIALPWYAIQDTAWYSVLPQIFGGPETANGLLQAFVHGRTWLLFGVIGLLVAAVGLAMPAGRAQGNWFVGGGLIGFVGLLTSAFSIGAKGWAFDALNRQSSCNTMSERISTTGPGVTVALRPAPKMTTQIRGGTRRKTICVPP